MTTCYHYQSCIQTVINAILKWATKVAQTPCKILELIELLPASFFIVGNNNVYLNSNHLLVPYPGENIPDDEDAFNFFLS
jgi:hypothetical protein